MIKNIDEEEVTRLNLGGKQGIYKFLKEFRIYGDKENPLFLAKDVANWIDISNHRDLLTRVEDDEKVVGLTDTLGGKQETWFLTEDGLYEVLMQSRKPIAKGSSVLISLFV